jgi:hypothetical protein
MLRVKIENKVAIKPLLQKHQAERETDDYVQYAIATFRNY